MCDANSAYSLADLDRLKALDEFDLLMIEQPLAWNDILDHVQLQKVLRTPICLDESILDGEDARKAIEAGACRIINIKLGRVGGYTEALQVHDVCRDRNIPVWCGGMLETGIGRAHNVALSTLANFRLPGDVSASKRYFRKDLIEPEVEVDPQGRIHVAAGCGHRLPAPPGAHRAGDGENPVAAALKSCWQAGPAGSHGILQPTLFWGEAV